MLGCNPGQLSFILRVASDTLPTPVNLKRWNIQCGSKCSLCGYSQPTTAHILGGCSVVLSQGHFTYRHDGVLHCLATEISKHFAGSSVVSLYADLPGIRASDCPQSTIPPSLIITSYCPDLVIYNQEINSLVMLELTCLFDPTGHLEAARDRKQGKTEYLEIVSELQRLGVDSLYET